MVALALLKTQGGYVPATEQDSEVMETHKLGQVIHADFKKMRNSKFHRKFFSLLNLGYESFEPAELSNDHGPVQKNFDQFREDVTILAGYYIQTVRLDGSVRVVAKSIKFGSMAEHEFNKLYSSVINVLLKNVLTNYKDQAEIDEVVEKVMSFA